MPANELYVCNNQNINIYYVTLIKPAILEIL